ncbi:BTAD domain-containing putative transcriptional regulator [Thermoflexus sp.]|uniref:AfsR/SARP family transcriptional regulator n=1 Tax=Thermoflexus sp. TaxID=1969742 RepID=UPI0035E4626D
MLETRFPVILIVANASPTIATGDPRIRYLEALLALAEGTLKGGEPQAALAWFQQALTADPYLEAACLGVLRCYLVMDQPAAALAFYRQYAVRLERDLGLRPSPEARALYESILRTQDRSR